MPWLAGTAYLQFPPSNGAAGVFNQANTFEATVADVIYFGDHLRLRCNVPQQADAMVKLPLGRHDIPAIGDTAFLYAAEEHLRVYR